MVDPSLLHEAARRVAEKFSVDRIILFGSQARRSADARSDVDLLIICSLPPDGASRREIITAMHHELRGLGFGSDLVVMTPEEFNLERQMPGSVARPASREGIIVYERAA